MSDKTYMPNDTGDERDPHQLQTACIAFIPFSDIYVSVLQLLGHFQTAAKFTKQQNISYRLIQLSQKCRCECQDYKSEATSWTNKALDAAKNFNKPKKIMAQSIYTERLGKSEITEQP